MRFAVATALTAALAAGCSSSRCGQQTCQSCTYSPGPSCSATCAPPAVQPVAPPAPVEAPEVTQISDRPQEASADSSTSAIREAQSKGYGHGPKYEWLVGRLQRVHVPGSDWKLRYLPLSVQDQYGGGVVLSIDARVDEFQDGDLVYIEGEIIGNRPTLYLSGPLYRITAIRAVPQNNPIATQPRSYQ